MKRSRRYSRRARPAGESESLRPSLRRSPSQSRRSALVAFRLRLRAIEANLVGMARPPIPSFPRKGGRDANPVRPPPCPHKVSCQHDCGPSVNTRARRRRSASSPLVGEDRGGGSRRTSKVRLLRHARLYTICRGAPTPRPRRPVRRPDGNGWRPTPAIRRSSTATLGVDRPPARVRSLHPQRGSPPWPTPRPRQTRAQTEGEAVSASAEMVICARVAALRVERV